MPQRAAGEKIIAQQEDRLLGSERHFYFAQSQYVSILYPAGYNSIPPSSPGWLSRLIPETCIPFQRQHHALFQRYPRPVAELFLCQRQVRAHP